MSSTPNVATAHHASAAPAPSSEEAVQRLRRLVDDSAGRWKRWMILEALALGVGLPLAYLWLVFILDNLVHLPVWGRLFANAVFLVATIYLIALLVRRRSRLRITEDQVALSMERRTPGGLQNRLINALQISRDVRAANADFGHAVIEENYNTLRNLSLQQAGQLRPAMLRVAFACAMVLVGILFWTFQREHFQNAATRIMLPLANINPIYQTRIEVEPGDVEGAGDIPIRVHISGQIPRELTVLRIVDGKRVAEKVAVANGKADVSYAIRSVFRTTTYAVQGGDFTTQYFRITVPMASSLAMVKATYQYPAYTQLPDRTTQSAGGDLEALVGTRAKVVFVFDHAPDSATLLLHKSLSSQPHSPGEKDKGNALVQTIPLTKLAPTEFAGEINFDDVISYQLQTRQGSWPPQMSGHYALNVVSDQDPNLQLIGLEKRTEAEPDALLSLAVEATDDFGLRTVGLYARKISGESAPNQGAPGGAADDEGWKPIEVWPASNALKLHKDARLSIGALGATEGEKYEIAPRGGDYDPLKKGALTTGPSHTLVIGGADVALQVLYEQILRSEADLQSLIASEEDALRESSAWMQKMNPASGLRWDDRANLDALAGGVKTMAAHQAKVRESAGRTAREMVAEAGNLRISIGMLADSEMVRAIRIEESIPTRDTVQEKRVAIADARLTHERTIRSLQEIAGQYTRFRQDWELSNMLPFIKMLADRQAALRDGSTKAANEASQQNNAALRQSSSRRQGKIAQLCNLARIACQGLGERVGTDAPAMGKAFADASVSFSTAEIKSVLSDAAALASEGRWAAASAKQDVAAKALAAIYQRLQAAKLAAAKDALAAIQEKAKSDAEAQKEIERLRAGSTENALKDVDEKKLTMAEIIHMREVAAAKKAQAEQDAKVNLYKFDDKNSAVLQQADSGKRQEFSRLKLGSTPTGSMSFPNESDRATNKVTPHIQQEFEDLVGKLLEESDELKEKYDTYNINMGVNIDEPGIVGKQGGDMNSTAAAAATGNMKPPPNDQGGISRQGRMGGRAHGMVMGNEGINRRGRDKVQEAQERIPDQAGTIKQNHSDDEQADISTGVGGKKAETDKETTFNTSDKGKFTDDMAGRMGKIAKRNAIVERQDGKMDPRVADMLRDLHGTQEQVIERLKVIRKELKSLYLPTDQVDEAIAKLTANLAALEERPSADLYRLQAQTLDKLRGAMSVFTQYGAGFQPSLPRDQAVRGRVLDEPARQPIPGYEEAVKHYYEMLAKP